MKIRIKTDQFKNIDIYEVKDYDDLTPLQQFCVDNEYPAFEPVSEIEEGQYWQWTDIADGEIFRIQEYYAETGKCVIKYIHTDQKATWFCNQIKIEATLLSDEQTEQALTREAERRYGDKLINSFDTSIKARIRDISDWEYSSNDWLAGWIPGKGWLRLYKQGQWAEPVEDEWEVVHKYNTGAYYVRNNNTEQVICTRRKNMDEEQAEAIKQALNEV